MVSLAFSMYANPGVYAVLLGSGVSRSAGILTGWEIVVDLCRKIAHTLGEEPGEHPDQWYLDKFGTEARYDELLAALGKTATERSKIVSEYFTPTEEDRQAGTKLPTPAHSAVASLVKLGYIRVIITTNFDRLMEMALDAEDVEYHVISTEDGIKGVQPYVHNKCTVIKLHGDFRDSRIRNTQEELCEYPQALHRLLDRILDEFGLILCGWSGTWDVALRNAMVSSPTRRYSWYWAVRGIPTDEAQGLITHRKAELISITTADSFYTRLAHMVEGLARQRAHHPQSVQVATALTKRLMVDDGGRIDLHDLVLEQVSLVRQAVNDLPVQNVDLTAEFRNQLEVYTHQTEVLRGVLATLGFFGDKPLHRELLLKAVQRLGQVNFDNGFTSLIHLRRLPALLAVYAGGVAAVGAGRFDNLRSVLVDPKVSGLTSLQPDHVTHGLTPADVIDSELLRVPAGMVQYPTPRNVFLWDQLRPTFAPYLPTQDEFDYAFDVFEFLFCLVYTANLVAGDMMWLPVGRYVSRQSSVRSISEFLRVGSGLGGEWSVLKELFRGNSTLFKKTLSLHDSYLEQFPNNRHVKFLPIFEEGPKV
jgi:hypothetical protein